MDSEIQPAKLLSFDPSVSSWEEVSTGSEIDGESGPSQTLTPSLTSIVIATWNVWEDDRSIEHRHPFILRKLFEDSSVSLDVITLQEVTIELFDAILAHPAVRNGPGWLVTDLKHQFDVCPNPYGTVILTRKSVAQGHICAAGFHEFENTRMERGLNFIELCSSSSRQPLLRIGTSHFESHPEDKRKRREQFEVSAAILTSVKSHFLKVESSSGNAQAATAAAGGVPAILTGDCNICSYDELTPLLGPAPHSPAFIDAFLAARPIQARESQFTSHPTYGVTITNRRMFGKQTVLGPQRLDYIFVRGFQVTEGGSEAGTIGDEPVCEKEEAEDEEGRDGRVYASDHLGVWVRVRP